MHAHRRLVPPRRAPPARRESGVRTCGRGTRETAQPYRPSAAKPCMQDARLAGSDQHRWRPAPAMRNRTWRTPSWRFSASNRAATASSSAWMAQARPPVTPLARASRLSQHGAAETRPCVAGRTPPGVPLATSPAIGSWQLPGAAASTSGPNSSIRHRVYSGFPPVWSHSRRAAGPAECPRQGSSHLGYLRRSRPVRRMRSPWSSISRRHPSSICAGSSGRS